MPRSASRFLTVSASRSKEVGSSKVPGTNRNPSARLRQTLSRNGVLAYCLTAS